MYNNKDIKESMTALFKSSEVSCYNTILGVGDGKLNIFRGMEHSYSVLDVFDDQNMRPDNATWHPRIKDIVYWGMVPYIYIYTNTLCVCVCVCFFYLYLILNNNNRYIYTHARRIGYVRATTCCCLLCWRSTMARSHPRWPSKLFLLSNDQEPTVNNNHHPPTHSLSPCSFLLLLLLFSDGICICVCIYI